MSIKTEKNDLKIKYFEHLVSTVCNKQHRKNDYIPLLDLLHSMKFVVVIDFDENRANDGCYLRQRWLQKIDEYDRLGEFEDDPASVLEVLIGIADRLEASVGDPVKGNHISDKFWELLRNLNIEQYDSKHYSPINIKERVRNWMYRKIEFNGIGGIFPLKMCENDQRDEEIWAQMNLYIMENYLKLT